jgi:hypothetical protein
MECSSEQAVSRFGLRQTHHSSRIRHIGLIVKAQPRKVLFAFQETLVGLLHCRSARIAVLTPEVRKVVGDSGRVRVDFPCLLEAAQRLRFNQPKGRVVRCN